MYRQAVPRVALSVERDTQSVPEDGHFHVFLRGSEILVSPSQKEALARYRSLKECLLREAGGLDGRAKVDKREALAREMADGQAKAFLAESSRKKRAKALRRGGPGGTGGVAG
jgi:hypothetical protein